LTLERACVQENEPSQGTLLVRSKIRQQHKAPPKLNWLLYRELATLLAYWVIQRKYNPSYRRLAYQF